MRIVCAAAAASAVLLGPAQAQSAKAAATPPAAASPKPAPISPDPAATSATYGDWVLRCQRLGEGEKAQRVCEVAQSLQIQGQQAPVAQIALGRPTAADPLKLTVALPTNITIPGSVTIGTSDKDPAPTAMTWRRCLPGACIADAVPTADILKSFRSASDPGRLAFKDAAGSEVALPFSFRGLAQALDALAKG